MYKITIFMYINFKLEKKLNWLYKDKKVITIFGSFILNQISEKHEDSVILLKNDGKCRAVASKENRKSMPFEMFTFTALIGTKSPL